MIKSTTIDDKIKNQPLPWSFFMMALLFLLMDGYFLLRRDGRI